MTEQTRAVETIPLGLIDAGPNARGAVGDVSELAASLKAIGQQVPVIVEQIGDRYELLDGHRRHAAAKQAGATHLLALVRPADPAIARRLVRQLSIQTHNERFSPMAEARALHRLMFGEGWTREQIAHAVGKPPGWVRDRISLVHLESREQADLEAGRLSLGEALLRLRNRRAEREGREPAQPRVAAPGLSPFQAGITARVRPAATTKTTAGRCPTCHQPIPEE